MKKTKIIVPALGMLLLSTAASVTGTVAWFSANAKVTAAGMAVKAKSINGLLISNASEGTYAASATALFPEAELYPTSTADFSNWFSGSSTKADNAVSEVTYTALTSLSITSGIGKTSEGNYFLVNSFFLKASTDNGPTVNAKIHDLQVTGSSASAELNESLRIAFVTGSDKFVYAPIDEDDDAAAGHNATWSCLAGDEESEISAAIGNQTPTEVKVYAYFEGEDKGCKSDNITETLDSLAISFAFSTVSD